MANAEALAKSAREETGLGRFEDKVVKNRLVTERTPGLEDLFPSAVTGDHGLSLIEPAPFGVDLKTVGAEVRYDLVYQYWGGGDSGMGRRDGGGGGPRQQNMARDVCVGLAP